MLNKLRLFIVGVSTLLTTSCTTASNYSSKKIEETEFHLAVSAIISQDLETNEPCAIDAEANKTMLLPGIETNPKPAGKIIKSASKENLIHCSDNTKQAILDEFKVRNIASTDSSEMAPPPLLLILAGSCAVGVIKNITGRVLNARERRLENRIRSLQSFLIDSGAHIILDAGDACKLMEREEGCAVTEEEFRKYAEELIRDYEDNPTLVRRYRQFVGSLFRGDQENASATTIDPGFSVSVPAPVELGTAAVGGATAGGVSEAIVGARRGRMDALIRSAPPPSKWGLVRTKSGRAGYLLYAISSKND